MSTMESLIGLVNRIQRACTVLGDHGGDNALPTLWEALPSVAVVGGQVDLSITSSTPSYVSSFYSISSIACLIWLVFAEFWKIFRSWEHRRSRFSSQGIWFGFLSFWYFFLVFVLLWFFTVWRSVRCFWWFLQGSWRGGLWFCSCTRQREVRRSLRSFFICQRGDLQISVCFMCFLYQIYLLEICFHEDIFLLIRFLLVWSKFCVKVRSSQVFSSMS